MLYAYFWGIRHHQYSVPSEKLSGKSGLCLPIREVHKGTVNFKNKVDFDLIETFLGRVQVCAECGWRRSNSIYRRRWKHRSAALVRISSICLLVVSFAENWNSHVSLLFCIAFFRNLNLLSLLFGFIGFARYQPGATSLEFHFHSDESIGLNGFLISFEQVYDC